MSLRTLKRKNGLEVYHLDLRIPDLDTGRRRRAIRSFGTTDRAQTEARYHRLAAELLPRIRASRHPATLHDLQDRVLKHQAPDRAPQTVNGLQSTFRSFSRVVDPSLPLDRLSRAMTDEWRQMTDRRPSANNSYLICLRSARKRLEAWEWEDRDPTPLAKVLASPIPEDTACKRWIYRLFVLYCRVRTPDTALDRSRDAMKASVGPCCGTDCAT